MHHGPAGKVECAHLAEPAGRITLVIDRPNPVRQRIIDQRRPEQDKETIRSEANAFGKGATDQGRRDDGKHPLVHAVNEDWNVRVRKELDGRDAVESKVT